MKIDFSLEELIWLKQGFEIDSIAFGKQSDNTICSDVVRKINDSLIKIQDVLDAKDDVK